MKISIQHDALLVEVPISAKPGDYILFRGDKAFGVHKAASQARQAEPESPPKISVTEAQVLKTLEAGPKRAYAIGTELGFAPNDQNGRTVVRHIINSLVRRGVLKLSGNPHRPLYGITDLFKDSSNA